MFGSSNDFFKQSPFVLNTAKLDLSELLRIKGRSTKDIDKYQEAFDFFTSNPSLYDGATIVKDLVDIRYGSQYLDVDAMVHDFEYITGANTCFIKKWKSDLNYLKNMELNGKGVRVFRMFLLSILGVLFVPYKLLLIKINKNKNK